MVTQNSNTLNTAESLRSRAQDYASNMAKQTQDSFQSTVESCPTSAVLASFGAGVVLGAIATHLLTPSKPTMQAQAENFTQRMIDQVRASMPSTWSELVRR